MILHDSGGWDSADARDRPSFSVGEPSARSLQTGWVAQLLDEFGAAWERGERPTAEVFLDRHPRLTLQPEAAIRVI
jgi:hypothetical protein